MFIIIIIIIIIIYRQPFLILRNILHFEFLNWILNTKTEVKTSKADLIS